jgi:hypothetical protein
LTFGPNLVAVSGTNVAGGVATDVVAIELALPEPLMMGLPIALALGTVRLAHSRRRRPCRRARHSMQETAP